MVTPLLVTQVSRKLLDDTGMGEKGADKWWRGQVAGGKRCVGGARDSSQAI